MKFVFYTNSISPHQLPLAQELVAKFGVDEYCYVYTTPQTEERKKMGWDEKREPWILSDFEDRKKARQLLMTAKVVMSGIRDIDLFKSRTRLGLKTIYCSERWFKPSIGILRLLSPSYFKMAVRFVRFLRNSQNLCYYPIGIHAARDMARLCGLINGDWRCLFRAPKLDFERNPGGRIWVSDEPQNAQNTRKYCLDKMKMWGYFVESSKLKGKSLELGNGLVNGGQSLVASEKGSDSSEFGVEECGNEGLKVLWVGRLLKLKRVDTIIKTVGECAKSRKMTLDIYGIGPDERRLKKLAAKYGDIIKFHPPVPIGEVRRLMRAHDVYVLSSNAYEGWGAVLSEALEEGMKVIGTFEAGASGTILPISNLFHAGDWRKMVELLEEKVEKMMIGSWAAKEAAQVLVADL